MENWMDIQGEIQCITNLAVYSIPSNVLLSFIPYLCILVMVLFSHGSQSVQK